MANILDRRKVTMISGRNTAIDYVAVEHLDDYVADAEKRWDHVIVGEVTDHGPGGAKGAYKHPEHLAKGISLEEHLDSLGINHDNDGNS